MGIGRERESLFVNEFARICVSWWENVFKCKNLSRDCVNWYEKLLLASCLMEYRICYIS